MKNSGDEMTNKTKKTGLHHVEVTRTYVDHLYTGIKVHGLITHLTTQIGEYRIFTNTKAFWEKVPNKVRKRLHNVW